MQKKSMVVEKQTSIKIVSLGEDASGGTNLLIDLPITADDVKEMREAAVFLLAEIDKLAVAVGKL